MRNQYSLLEIKLNNKSKEYEDLMKKVQSYEEAGEQKELKNALTNIAVWSDDELKKRDRAILQLT
jgi:hypothetical protein